MGLPMTQSVLTEAYFCFINSDRTRCDVQAYATAIGSRYSSIHLLRSGKNISTDVTAVPVEMVANISRPCIFCKNYSVLLNAYRMFRELCANQDLREVESWKNSAEYRQVTWLEPLRNLLGALQQRTWLARGGRVA